MLEVRLLDDSGVLPCSSYLSQRSLGYLVGIYSYDGLWKTPGTIETGKFLASHLGALAHRVHHIEFFGASS